MKNEFTANCNYYYKIMEKVFDQLERLKKMIDNAPVYKGESQLSEIDFIIWYCRKTQKLKAALDKNIDELKETAKIILAIMEHFEIPRGTVLNGVVIDKAEYEIWADEADGVHVIKTKTIIPPPDPDNIITIRFSDDVAKSDEDEDDEEFWSIVNSL